LAFTQDLFTSRRNYGDGNTRIGELERIWYDSITNTLRIGDGSTPGGVIIGSSAEKIFYETNTVTGPTYTITNEDFYVGINYPGPVTVTLPATMPNGRMYFIKDESGQAAVNPITVLGTVDNDAGGFIIQQNNGGVQLIYSNASWRII
jgi:hypothetical protein